MGDRRPMTFPAAFWFNEYMSLPVFWLMKSDFYFLHRFSYKSALFQRGPFILQDQGQEEQEWGKEDKVGENPFPAESNNLFYDIRSRKQTKILTSYFSIDKLSLSKTCSKPSEPHSHQDCVESDKSESPASTVDANDTLWYMKLALQFFFLQILPQCRLWLFTRGKEKAINPICL